MRTQIFTLKILFSVFAVFTLNLSWGQVFSRGFELAGVLHWALSGFMGIGIGK